MNMDRSSDRETGRRELPAQGGMDARHATLAAGLQTNVAGRVRSSESDALRADEGRHALERGVRPPAASIQASDPAAWNEVLRGGTAVYLDKSLPGARAEREDAMTRLMEQQRLLAIDPTRATPDQARDLGRQAVLNRVNSSIADGGTEAGYAMLRDLRAGLVDETIRARDAKRPRSLERLVQAGVAPQGADRVLPKNPEVHHAYLDGMELALVRRGGGEVPAAEKLIQDRAEHHLQEQLKVHGVANVLGARARAIAVESGPARAETMGTLRGVVEDMPAEARAREVNLVLKAMEQARERHALVAEQRAGLSNQSPEALRLIGELKAESRGPNVSESIREAYRQQELYLAAPRVRDEFQALKPYLDLRMAAVAHAESGRMAEASEIQRQAHEVFSRLASTGRLSEETVQGIRQAGMDPASTFEQLRGINPSQGERIWIDVQASTLRDTVPQAAEGVHAYAFRAPGRVFDAPLPIVAYQHQGQTHLAVEIDGKVRHAAVQESLGSPSDPLHSLAVKFQDASVHAQGSDFRFAQRGFLPLDTRPGRPGPGEGAPTHLGTDRTRGAA